MKSDNASRIAYVSGKFRPQSGMSCAAANPRDGGSSNAALAIIIVKSLLNKNLGVVFFEVSTPGGALR
jgi:hypothetical protein